MSHDIRPIGVFYEHQEWFRPLFRELERRELPHERLDARSHSFDPSAGDPRWSLVLNRVSPSAHTRGHGRAVSYTLAYLEHLERRGVRVVNGVEAFRTEISKARQVTLMEELGLEHPDTRVIDHPEQAVGAARELRFPVVVKPNRGGSGVGVRRFDDAGGLREAVEAGALEHGPDGAALVQEFVPARGGYVTRVEVLGGEFLYAIRVHLSGETFDLCPADIYRTGSGEELCPESGDAADAGLRVEASRPPDGVVRDVERLAAAGGVEVGGVEYLVDDRDGAVRFYDVNALSNFVAEPGRVVGFDPFARLAEWLEDEARAAEAARGAGGSTRAASGDGARRPVGGGSTAGSAGNAREGGRSRGEHEEVAG